jgi:hypothetical protein
MGDANAAVAGRMADAAHAWLDALDGAQRSIAHWPFPSDDERRLWFYTPTDHGGLPLAAMDPAQQRLAHRLLATGLSRPGYVTAATIMGLENVLDHIEGWTAGFGRARGRDPLLYYVRVFGDPGGGPWGWRLGGHHVSVSYTIVGGEVAATTPCFFGADPASAPLLGPHPLRPLAGVEDLARELIRSLDATQAAAAVVSPVAPVDLVGGNRSRLEDGTLPVPLPDVWRGHFTGEMAELLARMQQRAEETAGLTAEHLEAVRYTVAPKGLAAASLSAGQQEILTTLLHAYVGRIPDELADAEAAKFAGERLGDLHFLWAGGTEPGQPHYYRVQGPRLVVEYDNTQRDVNHIHSVWRDPEGDFGADALARHYAEHEH